jgi:hypothetical protein
MDPTGWGGEEVSSESVCGEGLCCGVDGGRHGSRFVVLLFMPKLFGGKLGPAVL